MLTFGELFAGVGGFGLGLERAGMNLQWQVEIDAACQKTLKKHWPDTKRYSDVRNRKEIKELASVDVITGGFP